MSPRLCTVLVASLVTTSCSLAPTYQVPETIEGVKAFKESADWKEASPQALLPGEWWTVFKDEELNRLQQQATASNQDMKGALARLDQAHALMDASRASFFPSFTASAGNSENRYSQNRPYFPTGAGVSPYFHDTQASAGVSYELDLWGRVRNSAQAAEASLQAASADVAVMELGIRSTLTMDYFALRATDTEVTLLTHALASTRKNLDLMQNLMKGGAASAADVALAEQQWQGSKTQLADMQLKRSQIEHAIAVLVGATPSGFSIAQVESRETTLPEIPGVLPSRLLERRPDVAASERRMAAANSSIGVARAAFFPTFSLNGNAGYETTSISKWFSAPSLFWSVGPNAAVSLFDGGLRQAVTDQSRAVYQEQVANYRNTVLHALQETEDALAGRRQLEQEFQSTQGAFRASSEIHHQAQLRYEAGLASEFDVVQARLAMIQSQINLETVRLARLNAQVLLVKALGGSW